MSEISATRPQLENLARKPSNLIQQDFLSSMITAGDICSRTYLFTVRPAQKAYELRHPARGLKQTRDSLN
jgi:hypothetical protein